jgi:hypothetical protein
MHSHQSASQCLRRDTPVDAHAPGQLQTTTSLLLMPSPQTDSTKAAKPTRPSGRNGDTQANIGYEEKLWKAADPLRGAMDAAEYKHVVLGLIFLK